MALEERGQVKTCLNHPDRTAAARCVACHKPLCRECVVSTTDGNFCSRECASKAADFKAHYKGPATGKKGLVRPIVTVIVIVVALAAVNKYVFSIPVVGGLLSKIPGFSVSAPR
jgi:hypothetical protein